MLHTVGPITESSVSNVLKTYKVIMPGLILNPDPNNPNKLNIQDANNFNN